MKEILAKAKELKEKEPNKAFELFKEVLSKDENNIVALSEVSHLLLKDKQNQKAMAFAFKALELDEVLIPEILSAKALAAGVVALAKQKMDKPHDAALRLAQHQAMQLASNNYDTHIFEQNPVFEAKNFKDYSPNFSYAKDFLNHAVSKYEDEKEPFYALASTLVAMYHADIKPLEDLKEKLEKKHDKDEKEKSQSQKEEQNEQDKIGYKEPDTLEGKIFFANAMSFLALLALELENKKMAKVFLELASNEPEGAFRAIKYRVLSSLALGEGDLEKAKEQANKALAHPNYKNHMVLANIAINEKNLKETNEQIQNAKTLAKNEKQNAEILSFEAFIRLKEGKKDEAKALANEALKANKRLKIAHIVLLNLEEQNTAKLGIIAKILSLHPYQLNFYNNAINIARALNTTNINNEGIQTNTSNEAFKGGKFDLAFRAALASLYYYPSEAKNTLALMNALTNTVPPSVAIELYSRAGVIDEVKDKAIKKLSTIYKEQKEYNKAYKVLEMLVKDEDTDPEVYKLQIEVALDAGGKKSVKTAQELIEKLKEKDSEDKDINLLQAKIYEKKGKYFEGIKELELVLSEDENNEIALNLIARCYNNINEYEKWEECLNKVIDIQRAKNIEKLKKALNLSEIDINDKRLLRLENEGILSTMIWTSHYIYGKSEKENFALASRYNDIIETKTRFKYDSYECESYNLKELIKEAKATQDPATTPIKELEPLSSDISSCEILRDYLRANNKKLRVGFTSGDFKNHPIGYIFEGIFKVFDKDLFELYAYNTQKYEDDLSARMKPCFDAWQNISGLSGAAKASKIHGDAIQVLIDLSVHSTDHALEAHAYKPTPVSVSWLGAPFSTGLKSIDYIIGDPIATPASEHEVLSERIFHLPSYWHFTMSHDIDSNELLAINPVPACERKGYFTFGSFNNLFKMHETLVALWAKILLAVPDSKLFLNYSQLRDESQKDRVRKWFGKYGVGEDRLILEFTTPRAKTLNTYNEIDLCLDTFPWTGATTSSEALMMGTPVLGVKGNSYISRAAQSILTNAGLAEFVAKDLDDYYAKAVYFATEGRGHLKELREGWRERMRERIIFDTARFTKDLENALLQMWINYELGVKLR